MNWLPYVIKLFNGIFRFIRYREEKKLIQMKEKKRALTRNIANGGESGNFKHSTPHKGL